MSNSKNFNFMKYVYGQLYLHSLTTTRSSIIIESWKYYKGWRSILNWLQNNQYISCLQVTSIDNQQKQITYIFNHEHLMYKPYLNYLQKMTEVKCYG